MGRNPKNIETKGDLVTFKVTDRGVLEPLQLIAKREGKELRWVYSEAFREYVERHGPGNYQTLLGSYQPGGVKSDGQLEAAIINEIKKREPRMEVKFQRILVLCRDYGFKKDIAAAGDRITHTLIKEGWKVWR